MFRTFFFREVMVGRAARGTPDVPPYVVGAPYAEYAWYCWLAGCPVGVELRTPPLRTLCDISVLGGATYDEPVRTYDVPVGVDVRWGWGCTLG